MPFSQGDKRPEGSGIKKGQKQGRTIAKEKARELFEKAQLAKWLEISDKQAEDALKDRAAREYTINQVIGKPTETVKVEEEVTLKLDA